MSGRKGPARKQGSEAGRSEEGRPEEGRPEEGPTDGDGSEAGTTTPSLPLFASQRTTLTGLLARRQRLPHALLIAGAPGIGKSAFALALAQALLCEALDGANTAATATATDTATAAAANSAGTASGPALAACGHCLACRWFAAGHHPDFQAIGLQVPGEDKPANEIAIDRIRELDGFARLSPFRGGRRLIVIDPADALNTASSNALLKLLEEPGPATHLLLVATRADRLMATIRSRTQRVALPPPGSDEAAGWLVAETGIDPTQARSLLGWAGGSPRHARTLADPAVMTAYRGWLAAIAGLPDTSIVTAAEQFGTADTVTSHGLLLRWVTDLARVRAGARPAFFPDAIERLQQLARRCPAAALMVAVEALQSQGALVRHPLNPRLFLEQAFARYVDIFDGRAGSER